MMWFQTAVVLLASCATKSLAIFADEVNHLDFHHALVGMPSLQSTFFHRPSSTSNASLLYTISENLIVGAINPKDGAVVWRQDLARWAGSSSAEGFLRASDGESTVFSAAGENVVAWSATDGKLAWDSKLNGEAVKDLELLELEDGRTTNNGIRDVLTLYGGKQGLLRRLDGSTGEVKWEYKDDRYSFFLLFFPNPSHFYAFG
jgi:hypothetical protein